MFFNSWKIAGAGLHPQIVPYDLLTDKEKFKNRERSQELLKYLQFTGYKLLRFDLPLYPPHLNLMHAGSSCPFDPFPHSSELFPFSTARLKLNLSVLSMCAALPRGIPHLLGT